MKELSDALLALELMPEKVRDLACNPTAGERYRWSYAAALSLMRCGYSFQLIEPLLEHYRGRPDNWAGELRAQIGNAANTILSCGSSDKSAIPTVAFTSMDADRVWSWLKEGRTLRALTASSPSNPHLPAEEILRVLFPDNPYVCATPRSRDNQVTMAVDSGPGGKSVHGWFFAPAIADHNEFCTIARKCGADRRRRGFKNHGPSDKQRIGHRDSRPDPAGGRQQWRHRRPPRHLTSTSY